MGIPERKVVPIRVGEDDSSSETERLIDCSHDCSNGQLNGQLEKFLTAELNSRNMAVTERLKRSPASQSLRSRNHKILLSYLSSEQVWLTTNKEISVGSGIPFETIRYGLRKLVAIGCITKKRYSNCGLKIEVLTTAGELGIETQHPNLTVKADKIDRLYNKSIYPSQKDIDRLWPETAKRGFLAVHYRELIQDFKAKDFDASNIKQALNYIEFQLLNNALVDRFGNPVGGVPGWLMTALRSNGYYSRPKNYVSPEEQAELDLLKEEKRIAEIRKEAKELLMNNWWDSLPPDHPAKNERMLGGTKASWIAHQYQKYVQEPQQKTSKDGNE